MFEATLRPQADFANKMYDIMFQIAENAQADRDQLNDLPYLLSRAELAKHVFNVSPQTLDTHIVKRADFPKIYVGERVLYPKDKAVEWIHSHMELIDDVVPEKKL